LQQLDLQDQLVAGNDRLSESRLVESAKVVELLISIREVAQKKKGTALGHGLDDEHSGHDRCAGEMTLKKLLVGGDILQTNDPLSFLDLKHAIDQQHRIAMRQEFHDFEN